MGGFPGWNNSEFFDGWYETNTEGIANLYLTITDEAIVTARIDSPSSKTYKARVMNADTFSIKRRPIVWPWGDTSVQLAAFGQLQLDNYDGFYSFLVGADLRDTIVQISVPRAMAHGTANLILNAPVICTAILDNVTCDNEDVITITLKDTLSRLDKSLPVAVNPPFVDSGAANRTKPLSFGACRNRVPLLIDGPNRIYQLHDSSVNNVAAVRDKSAPLDPNATPPQYTPALSGSGMQLETDPVGKVTVDLSSVGTQVIIPGVEDVLAGAGVFDSWSGSPSVPVGWAWSNNAGSLIQRLQAVDGYPLESGEGSIAKLTSSIEWYPPNAHYGDQLSYPGILEGGKSYRVTFKVWGTFSSPPTVVGGLGGGLMVRSALSNLAEDAISPHGQPLTVPLNQRDSYVFEFSVPAGAARDLIFLAVTAQGPGGTANGIGGGLIYDVKLEELGQFLELPLEAINLQKFFYEILIARAGEDDSVYEPADLEAIDTAADYSGFGIAYDEPPNILDCLREALDAYGGTLSTDSEGVVRAAILTDPHEGTPIAAFDETNVVRPIKFEVDAAANLTTTIGVRRNQSPGQDSDFVTDTDIVPAEVKARYMKTSQYTIKSSKSPAGQYDFAKDAGIFHSVLDDPADGQIEIDRVCGIWSPQVYDNGDVITGKRRFVTFTALFDDPEVLGVGTQCAVTEIGFNDVIEFHYPRHGFDHAKLAVVGWEIFPFSKKITLTCFGS